MGSSHQTAPAPCFFPRAGSCSLESLPQLLEAARDPACDRPGGEPELFADRPVALVPAKEAVERTLRIWSAIPDTTQIAEECRLYLRAIGLLKKEAS